MLNVSSPLMASDWSLAKHSLLVTLAQKCKHEEDCFCRGCAAPVVSLSRISKLELSSLSHRHRLLIVMYSVHTKRENAHTDSIWDCDWARVSESSEESSELSKDLVVTGGVDERLKIWTFQDNDLKLEHELTDHSLGILSVALTKDAKRDLDANNYFLASSSLDATIYLWCPSKGQRVQTMNNRPMDAWTLAFSPCSKQLITGSHLGQIVVMDTESAKETAKMDTKGKFILSVAYVRHPVAHYQPSYSPDGRLIASGAVDGIVHVFEASSSKLVHKLEGHAMPVRSMAFTSDSQRLITASDDKQIKIYDINHGNLIGTLSGHTSWALSVRCSPDNEHFVSTSSDHTVKVWSLKKMECLHTFKEHSGQVWAAVYNPEGNKIASVSEDKQMLIYDLPS